MNDGSEGNVVAFRSRAARAWEAIAGGRAGRKRRETDAACMAGGVHGALQEQAWRSNAVDFLSCS